MDGHGASRTEDLAPTQQRLTHHPFPQDPPYWQFNDQFLGLLKDYERQWKEEYGVDWKVGIELEFRLDPIDAANDFKSTDTAFSRVIAPLTTYEKQGFLALEAPSKTHVKNYRRARDALIEENLARYNAKIDDLAIHNLSGWRQLQDIENAALGLREHVMLEVHNRLLPDIIYHVDEPPEPTDKPINGVKSCILPLLGKSYQKNRDFYESRELGILELRLKPASPEEAIANFHRAVECLREEARTYGLRFAIRPNIHVHFSAEKDEKPVTLLPQYKNHSPVRPGFYENMLSGIMNVLHDGFALYDHGLPDQTPRLRATYGRTSAINTLSDRFELRCGDCFPPHLAKQLSLVLGGALLGARHPDAPGMIPTQTVMLPCSISDAKNRKERTPLYNTVMSGHYDVRPSTEEMDFVLPFDTLRPYEWFLIAPIVKEVAGITSLRHVIPGQPLFNLARYQPVLDDLHRIPLKKTHLSGELQGKETYIVDLNKVPHKYHGLLGDMIFVDHINGLLHSGYERPADRAAAVEQLAGSAMLREMMGEELVGALAQRAQEFVPGKSTPTGRSR